MYIFGDIRILKAPSVSYIVQCIYHQCDLDKEWITKNNELESDL